MQGAAGGKANLVLRYNNLVSDECERTVGLKKKYTNIMHIRISLKVWKKTSIPS